MKKNDVYKGFKVISVCNIKDYDSTAIYLRHEESGLEVFKMLNDDRENLFSFAFRTPCENSTGVAHALEHTVLCGSKKYPSRDPFMTLANQSVNTYLNAYTCPEHTVFPSSSPVKADFYNIFSVYADAVFFPRLQKGAFLQECHRIEKNEDGKLSIQGVVYNEMKGNYSSFENVAADTMNQVLMQGTEYVYDSGGDPAAIPSLTYEAFKDYHKRYYCTANCLVFLYGDIPLEEELDFLISNVTSRVSSFGTKTVYPAPDFSKEVEHRVTAYGPSGESSDESRRAVSMEWRISNDIQKEDIASFSMFFFFLDELLWGDDSAPVAKKMLDSQIGSDIAPYTGADLNGRYPTLCFSMNGVKKGDEEKFKETFLSVLRKLVKNGISKEDLERTSMTFDFNNREIKRPDSSPYSIVLMRRAIKSWIFGFAPDTCISYRNQFEKLKEQIKSNPNLIQERIQHYLLDNENWSLVSVEPSAEWTKQRSIQEQQILDKQYSEMGEAQVLDELKEMHDFQSTKEDDNSVPHLHKSDLPSDIVVINCEKEQLGDIPLFVSKEPTNGISYCDVAFPFDTLDAEEYLYISFLARLVSQLGADGMPWHEMMSRLGSVSGGFGVMPRSFDVTQEDMKKLGENPFLGRDIFIFRFKCLDEKLHDNFELLASYLRAMDFSDTKRISDLLASHVNDAKSSVVPEAHIYAMSRSIRNASHNRAVQEILSGLTAVVFAEKMAKMNIDELAKKLECIYKKIIANGAVIHITAEEASIAQFKNETKIFIQNAKLKPPVARPEFTKERNDALLQVTELNGESNAKTPDIDEIFVIPGTVGFDSKVFASSPYGTKESIADTVFARCLSTTDLWDKVRTVGGAYGVYFVPNGIVNSTYFVTYRDPKPVASLKALADSLNEDGAELFDTEEVEKAITGCYSSVITPRTPAAKGLTGFLWFFNGGSNDEEKKRVLQLLSIDGDDLKDSCLRYRKSLAEKTYTVILCPASMIDDKIRKSTGKIINLPL